MGTGFVVGFGGTGARCLEALTYVAAAGVHREPLHVLMVDPDASNGNLRQLKEQLGRYQSVQEDVAKAGTRDLQSLFSLPINSEDGESSCAWQYPSSQQPFATLLDLHSLPAEQRHLLELLYDDDDMKLDFKEGYIGRAHIGSLDLLRVLGDVAAPNPDGREDDALKILIRQVGAASTRPEGTHIVVVGSLFGGSGASGLPAFPRFLQKVLTDQVRKKMRLTAVLLAPYFGFPPGDKGNPESSLHPLATQASLHHYAYTATGYDRMYLIGAPSRPNTSTVNWRGGLNQRNEATYVELGAALAVANALADPNYSYSSTDDPTTEVFTSESGMIDWDKMPHISLNDLRRRMAVLATSSFFQGYFMADELSNERHHGSKWLQDLVASRLRRLGGREPKLANLRDFCKGFVRWMGEVERHEGNQLFHVGALDQAHSIGTVTGDYKRPTEAFHELVEGLNRVPPLDAETGVGWYVRALSRSAEAYCASNYRQWWNATAGKGQS